MAVFGSNPNDFRSRQANISEATHALNDAVEAWGRERLPGCRVLHELCLGSRRIDIVLVGERDLIGVETKGAKERAAGLARLDAQMEEFRRYIPEVWVAIDAEHVDKVRDRNLLKFVGGRLVAPKDLKPGRDELVIPRLLDILWTTELARIAERKNLCGGPVHKQMFDQAKLKKLAARLLTGNEILEQVCAELRTRPLTGVGSDKATAVRKPRVEKSISNLVAPIKA